MPAIKMGGNTITLHAQFIFRSPLLTQFRAPKPSHSATIAHSNSTDSLSSRSIDGDSLESGSVDFPLPLPPDLNNKAPRKYWNAVALAFLGDSVWEMYVRRKFFYPPAKMQTYYASVIHNVRAEKQEEAYDSLIASELLLQDEKDVLRWGLNATGTTPKRLSNAPLKKQTYRAATALECLIGYLYLTSQERLHLVLDFLDLQPSPKKTK